MHTKKTPNQKKTQKTPKLAKRLFASDLTQIIISYRNVIRVAYNDSINQSPKQHYKKKKPKETLGNNFTNKHGPDSKSTAAMKL